MEIKKQIPESLTVGTIVKARAQACKCQPQQDKIVQGTIVKVITTQTQNWYYLNIGTTVGHSSIIEVVSS